MLASSISNSGLYSEVEKKIIIFHSFSSWKDYIKKNCNKEIYAITVSVQIASNQNIQSMYFIHTYVMKENLTTFWKKLWKLTAFLITLHLAPFAFKLVNNSSRTEFLKTSGKSTFWYFRRNLQAIFESFSILKDSMWLEFWTNLDVKGTEKKLYNFLQVYNDFLYV